MGFIIHSFIWFHTIICFIILYYTLLCITILYYTIVYHPMTFYTISYYIKLFYTILTFMLPYNIIQYCTTPHYTILHTILYYPPTQSVIWVPAGSASPGSLLELQNPTLTYWIRICISMRAPGDSKAYSSLRGPLLLYHAVPKNSIEQYLVYRL